MNSAAELIGLAGVISVEISKCMTPEEMHTLIEFLGLLKHNLEVIKHRKVLAKIEVKEKDDDKKDEKKKESSH